MRQGCAPPVISLGFLDSTILRPKKNPAPTSDTEISPVFGFLFYFNVEWHNVFT